MPDLAQPNAERMPEAILDGILDTLSLCTACAPESIIHKHEHSNDFAEVRLRNGSAIIVKRGRFEWAKSRFETSRAASRLIRRETDVAVPAPLPLPRGMQDPPVEAYWRIDLPTLQEVWPDIRPDEKTGALRSWGALAAELHSIETTGYGMLVDDRGSWPTVGEHLHAELIDRLLPAVIGEWPAAEESVYRLAAEIGKVQRRVQGRSGLLHGDLHTGNVLCERRGGPVVCVGLIDLETAQAGPPEADLAIMEVHHGDLFNHPIPGNWLEQVMIGYGQELDPWLINFYRVFHLLNMGFYSALIGHEWHAARVAEQTEAELDQLTGRR